MHDYSISQVERNETSEEIKSYHENITSTIRLWELANPKNIQVQWRSFAKQRVSFLLFRRISQNELPFGGGIFVYSSKWTLF